MELDWVSDGGGVVFVVEEADEARPVRCPIRKRKRKGQCALPNREEGESEKKSENRRILIVQWS